MADPRPKSAARKYQPESSITSAQATIIWSLLLLPAPFAVVAFTRPVARPDSPRAPTPAGRAQAPWSRKGRACLKLCRRCQKRCIGARNVDDDRARDVCQHVPVHDRHRDRECAAIPCCPSLSGVAAGNDEIDIDRYGVAVSVLATCWNVPSKPPPAPFCRTSLTPITPPAGTANHRLLQTGLVGHSRRKMPVFHGPKWADSWHLVDFVGML